MSNIKLKDSGTRVTYSTGAKKEAMDPEKGRYDLIPPEALHALAVHYARGALKYSEEDPTGRNWELGIPLSRCFDSLLRHAMQARAGQTDEQHIVAVMFWAFAIYTYLIRIKEGKLPENLIDIPEIMKVK